MRDYLAYVLREDLSGGMKELSDLIGLEATMGMIRGFSRKSLRFSKKDITLPARNRRIVSEHMLGKSVEDLCAGFDLSKDSIVKIIRSAAKDESDDSEVEYFEGYPVRKADLSPFMRRVASAAGFVNAMKIIQAFDELRIQSYDSLNRNIRNRLIINEYEGGKDIERLAGEYGLRIQYIKRLSKRTAAIIGSGAMF